MKYSTRDQPLYLARETRKLQGYPHALVKLDIPLRSFFRKTIEVRTTQHLALDLRATASKLADPDSRAGMHNSGRQARPKCIFGPSTAEQS